MLAQVKTLLLLWAQGFGSPPPHTAAAVRCAAAEDASRVSRVGEAVLAFYDARV